MERLGIVLALDGSLETTNGLKLTSDSAAQLGKELDALNGKSTTAAQGQKAVADASRATGSASAEAARGVAQLGRELAQGDMLGAARQAGQLAMGSQAIGTAMAGAGAAALVAGGIIVATVGAVAYAFYQGAEEERKFNDTLILTGNYAGMVAGQLDRMASNVARGINGSVGASREVLAGLAGTGRVTVESLAEVGAAAQLVQRFTGQTSEAVVKQFAGMSDGVAKWAAKNNEAYHFLTLETYRYIKSLEDQGRTQEAMKVASEALSNHLGGDLTRNLGLIDRAWGAITRTASGAWAAMKDVGKDDSTDDMLRKGLEYAENARKGWMAQTPKGQADLAALDARNQALFRQSEREKSSAASASAQQQLTERNIKLAETWGRIEDQNRTKAEQMTKALKEAREAGLARGAPEADIRRVEASIREKYADKRGAPSNAADTYIAGLEKQLRGVSKEASAYADALDYLDINAKKFNGTQRETALGLAKQLDDQKKLREITQIREKNEQAAARDLATHEKELEGLIKTNEGLRQQAQQVGLTKVQLGALKAERLDGIITMERENLVVQSGIEGNEARVGQIERHIRLLEQQRELTQEVTAKTDAADKEKAQKDASKKFGEDVTRDLKDGLIRGFEAGKNPARSLADTLGNIVKQRLVSAFADSILNSFQPLLEQVLGNARLRGVGGGTSGGGLGGILNLFGMGGGTGVGTDIIPQGAAASAAEFGSGGMMDALASFGVFHSGGMAGGAAPGSRTVSASLFKGAPRFHGGGIASNERAIIAKDDEGIFTRDQMANLAPVGAAAPVINIITPPGTKAETRQRQGANGGMQTDVIISQVEDALADRVSAGTGSLFGSMQGRFGLRTQVG